MSEPTGEANSGSIGSGDPSSLPNSPEYDLPGDLVHIHLGKVRDLYRAPDGALLVVASDRISAYDHVLETPIPDKGRILTSLSQWWFTKLQGIAPIHVRPGSVPAAVRGRAMWAEELDMFPVECVARGYLAGSGLLEYRDKASVCGVNLPPGLKESFQLPKVIFTPATKAPAGEHDENVTFDEVMAMVGQEEAQTLRRYTLHVYEHAARIAAKVGLILADTKLEFGQRADGTIVLADEVLTPDSSRYWDKATWEPGMSAPSFDKQYVRDWLTSPDSGWDRHGSEVPPPLPDEVVDRTRSKYIEVYERLTGDRFV